jgi:hypothetical protein
MMAPEGMTKSVEFIHGMQMDISGFKVSVQPVSFHHPLHWFFSHLLASIPMLGVGGDEGVWRVVFPFEKDEYEDRVLRLIEPTIRVASLLSQVKTGKYSLWLILCRSLGSKWIQYSKSGVALSRLV